MLVNQNKKTIISLTTSLLAMVLSMAISFFLSPYIVSNFGEEANGFTQLANNFINYATLLTVALNSMAGRFITVAFHRGEIDRCNKYYSSVLIGNLFIVCLLALPAIYFVLRLDALLNIETAVVSHVKILFAFVFANFFISQINSIFAIAFYVTNSQYIQNTINMVRTLLNACGLLILFSVFLPRIFYVSLVALALSALLLPIFMIFKRKLLPTVKFSFKSFSIKTVWEMVSSGLWNTLNQCGNLLMTGLDLLLSNLFINPVQMGVLSVAKTIPNTIVQLGTTVNTNFSPNLTIAYAEGDKEKILASLRYAMKCSSILMCLPIVVLCVYGSSFYSLWQPTLDANELNILSILSCMAFIPLSGTQVLYNVFTTTNKLKVNSISVVVCGLLNCVVVFLLLKFTSLGLYAIAGVSSIIMILRNLVIAVPYSAKVLGLKWYTFYKDVLISCISAVVAGAICFGFRYLIVPSSWILLVVSVLVACLVSFVVLMFIILNKNERKTLLSKFRRKKRWTK